MYLFKTRKTRLVQLTVAINIHDNTKLINTQWIKKKHVMGGKGGGRVLSDKIWNCPVNLLNSALPTGHMKIYKYM